MGETEIRTANAGESVTVESVQSEPQSKSKASQSGQRKSAKASGGSARGTVKVNAQGTPVTQWDNPDNDPNKRASIAEDPTGEGNKLKESK